MRLLLSSAFAFFLAGAALACPAHEHSAQADMTRVASLPAPVSVPVDPATTASTEPPVSDAEAQKAKTDLE